MTMNICIYAWQPLNMFITDQGKCELLEQSKGKAHKIHGKLTKHVENVYFWVLRYVSHIMDHF